MSEQSNEAEYTYDASSIVVLEALEAVRKRPGMYIGGCDEQALMATIEGLLEFMLGLYDRGEVDGATLTVERPYSLSLELVGVRWQNKCHPQDGRAELELLLSTLSAGGWKRVSRASLYCFGMPVFNALCSALRAVHTHGGETRKWRFKDGRLIEHEVLSEQPWPETLTFHATLDPQFFTECSGIRWTTLVERVDELMALNPGMSVQLRDEASGLTAHCVYPQGIQALLPASQEEAFTFTLPGPSEFDQLSIALALRDAENATWRSYVEELQTPKGIHVSQVRAGIRQAIKDVLKVYPQWEARITPSSRGIAAVIQVKLEYTRFNCDRSVLEEGIDNVWVKRAVSLHLTPWLMASPQRFGQWASAFQSRKTGEKA
ncbi:MAG: hypothetical protein ACE366_22625 [Bradymonadia bacterium]